MAPGGTAAGTSQHAWHVCVEAGGGSKAGPECSDKRAGVTCVHLAGTRVGDVPVNSGLFVRATSGLPLVLCFAVSQCRSHPYTSTVQPTCIGLCVRGKRALAVRVQRVQVRGTARRGASAATCACTVPPPGLREVFARGDRVALFVTASNTREGNASLLWEGRRCVHAHSGNAGHRRGCRQRQCGQPTPFAGAFNACVCSTGVWRLCHIAQGRDRLAPV